MTSDSISACGWKVRRFAEQSCRGESPLYEHLCSRLADDERLLQIVQATPTGQPVPNLFLAGVHFLLLAGVRHELAEFYGSCVANPKPPQSAFPAFREFCLRNESAIRDVTAQRRVQTNEVRRCAYLLLACSHITHTLGLQPLALIEVGTSAGLNLIFDRYAYDYGTGKPLGRPEAKCRITTDLLGNHQPPLPDQLPPITLRVGVDLHVADVAKPAECLWLRSLVWPDQPERMQLLAAAIEQCRNNPPCLIEGDALDLLPSLMRQVTQEATVCVFHCHTLNQFSEQQREQFGEVLADASRERPVVELSAEWIGTPSPQLWLLHWNERRCRKEHLANVDHHGRWIEWLIEGALR